MLKKYLITFCVFVLMTINTNAAGTSDNDESKVKSDYDKAVTIIKSEKKYEKKSKTEKCRNDSYKTLS